MDKFLSYLYTCTFVLFSFCIPNIIHATEYLSIIDNLEIETIKNKNLLVIEQVGDQSITILSRKDSTFLTHKSYNFTIIDTDPYNKTYYLVYPIDRIISKLNLYGTLLFQFPQCYLVRVNKDKRQNFLDLHAEFYLLSLDPMNFSSEIPEKLKCSKQDTIPDPKLKELLNKVSEDSIINNILWLQNVGTRHVSYRDNPKKVVPWIEKKLIEYGCDSVYRVPVQNYNAPNVIGVKLGVKYPSYKNYAILGAHLDAVPRKPINKGADDNASGTASVLEAARIFKDYKFENTIKYILFNCEEVGIVGSSVLAKMAKNTKDTIISFVNIEMCGHVPRGQDGYIALTPKKRVHGTTELANLYIKMAKLYTTQLCYFDPSEVSNSDHGPYWRQGFCAIKLREKKKGRSYHTIYDTLWAPNGLNTPKQVMRTLQAAMATTYMLTKLNDTTKITQKKGSTKPLSPLVLNIDRKKLVIPLSIEKNEKYSIKILNCRGQKLAEFGPFVHSNECIRINKISKDKKSSKRGLKPGVYIIALQTETKQIFKTFLSPLY